MFSDPVIQDLKEHMNKTLQLRLQEFLEPGHSNYLNRQKAETSSQDSLYTSEEEHEEESKEELLRKQIED